MINGTPNIQTRLHTRPRLGNGPGVSFSSISESILLIEDSIEPFGTIRGLISQGLAAESTSLIHSKNIDQAMSYLEVQVPNLIVYSVGKSKCVDQDILTIRTLNYSTPILLPRSGRSDCKEATAICEQFTIFLEHERMPLAGNMADELPIKRFAIQKSESPSSASHAAHYRITLRERDILNLIAEGLSNKEIARQLILSPGTVKNYVARLLQIFEVTSRAKLIARINITSKDF